MVMNTTMKARRNTRVLIAKKRVRRVVFPLLLPFEFSSADCYSSRPAYAFRRKIYKLYHHSAPSPIVVVASLQ
jgi:hypothetical protein